MQKGEEPSNTRLNDRVRRFLDQKGKDWNFDARRDDKTGQGAAVKRNGAEERSGNAARTAEAPEVLCCEGRRQLVSHFLATCPLCQSTRCTFFLETSFCVVPC